MPRTRWQSDQGYVMVTALIALAVMSILAAVAMSQATTALRSSRHTVRLAQAFYMANAGVEMVLARTREDLPVDPSYTHTVTLETGVTGRYEVTVTTDQDVIQVVSRGTIDDGTVTEQTIRAEIPWVGGDTGSGGGEQPDQLAVGNGPLTFQNKADVCGDLLANGNLTLGNNVTVWNRTKFQDSSSPCDSILGSGRAVAMGVFTMGNGSVVQGGICDNSGSYPCSEPPNVTSITPPDWNDLKLNQASRWWVKSSDSAFCSDPERAGNCSVIPAKGLTLSGTATYSKGEVLYIDGDLLIDNLTVAGDVTFAATGQIELKSNLMCSSGNSCNNALIAGGDLDLGPVNTVMASLLTTGTLYGNQATVYGLISAGSLDLKNGVTLYPTASWPVGVPGNPRSPETLNPAGGYSKWTQ